MKLTPEMIDALVIQLRTAFEYGEGIPDNIRASGKVFLDDLDAYSEELKKKAQVSA